MALEPGIGEVISDEELEPAPAVAPPAPVAPVEDFVPDDQVVAPPDPELVRADRIVQLADIMGELYDPDRKAAVLSISRKTGAPPDFVEGQFDFWKTQADQSTSPQDFYERNPELAAIALDQPWVGKLVTRDKALSTLQKVLGRVVGVRPATEEEQILALEQGLGPIETTQVRSWAPYQKETVEQGAIGKLEGAERVTGHWVTEPSKEDYVDPYTGEVYPAGTPTGRQETPGIYQYRFAQSLGNLDQGRDAIGYAEAVMAGGDGYEYRKRMVAARNRPGQDLQENWLEGVGLGVAELLGSEAISTGATAIGFAVAGPAGAATARTVAGAGSFTTSWVQEFGTLADFLEQRDDSGKPMDPQVAIGAAIAYATVSSAVETGVNLGPWAKLIGPLGKEGVKADVKAFLKVLGKDATKKEILLRVAQAWAKAGASEGGEEAVQGIISDAFGWYTRSRSSGLGRGELLTPQNADPVASIGENLDVGAKVAVSAGVLGAAPAGLSYRSRAYELERATTAGRQLAAIVQAVPDSPTAVGAPEAFAAAVAAETAATGEKVTAAYIDPSGINRLAQEANVDPVDMVREVAGEAGVKLYQEALATGEKIAVPMAEYVERWHQTGLAEALLPDTTTRSTGVMTPREAVADQKRITEETTRLVAEIGSKEDAPTPSEQLFTQIATDLAKAGKLKASGVEPQVKLWRKAVRTEAAQNSLDVEEVAKAWAVRITAVHQDALSGQALAQPEPPGSKDGPPSIRRPKRQGGPPQIGVDVSPDSPMTAVEADPATLRDVQSKIEESGRAGRISRLRGWLSSFKSARTINGIDFVLGSAGVKKMAVEGNAEGIALVPQLWELLDNSVLIRPEDGSPEDRSTHEVLRYGAWAVVNGETRKVWIRVKDKDAGPPRGRHHQVYFVESIQVEGRVPDALSSTAGSQAADRATLTPGKPTVGGLSDQVKGTPRTFAGEGSKGGVRGWMETVIAAGRRIQIALTEKQDMSTFLHESAHAFWELKAGLAESMLPPELASDPEALKRKEAARADMQAALEFMGVKDRAELDERSKAAAAIRGAAAAEGRELTAEERAKVKDLVEPFERWARGFEAYLMEGKAPSLSLAGAFRTFSLWLRDVYRSLASLGVELTPEIRGVFDRMLATDAEIAAAAKQIGIDGPALEQAKSRAEVAALKEVQRATEHWWKVELVKALEEAEKAYDQLPEVVNNDLLRRGREAGLDGLPTKQPVPPRKAWVENHAAETMAIRHPGILEERGRLKALVEKALHEEPSVVEELHRQWTEDRKKAGRKDGPPIESIKAAARIIVGRQLLQQLDPRRYFHAERAALKKRAAAEAKGDWAAAALASQQRLLNFYLYREALRAKEQLDQVQELAGKMLGEKGQERLGKASPIFRDFTLRLLEAVGLVTGVPAEVQAVGLTDLINDFKQPSTDLEPDFDTDVVGAFLASPRPFADLTVAELEELDRALKQIRRAARDRSTVKVGNQRVSLDALVGDIKSEVSRLPERAALPEVTSQPNEGETGRTVMGFIDSATDPLTTFLDDDYLGPLARQALRDRYYAQRKVEHELLGLVAVKVAEALDGMSPEMRANLYNEVDRSMLPRFEGQRRAGKVDRTWMLLLLANLGNEGNMSRLLGGRDWTMEQVQAFFQANKLTAEEARFIQGLWTLNDKHLWPRIAAVHEAVNGTKPEKVQAAPLALTLADGTEITLTGGYWPAMADPKESELGKRQEDVTTAHEQNYDAFRATLLKGFTRRRASDASYVVRLDDFGAYPAHVLKVIRYIAYEEFVRDAGRILLRIQPDVEARLGESAFNQIDRWLKVVASGSPDSISKVEKELVRIIGFTVGRTVRTAMLLNIKNAMADLASPLLALVGPRNARVRPDYLLGATLEGVGGLVVPSSFGRGFWAMRQQALAESDELRLRADKKVRLVRDQFDRFGAGGRRWRPLAKLGSQVEPGRIIDWVAHHGFIFQHVAEVLGTTLAWHAAKRQALARGASEMEARRRADDIIQKNWGSDLAAEKSALLRSRGAAGSLLMMQGFFNRMLSKSRQTVHPALVEWANAEGWKGKGKAALTASEQGAMLAGIWFITNVIGSLLEGRGPEEGEDDLQWLKRKMIAAPLTQVPLLNELTPFVEAAVADESVRGKLRFSASERASPLVSSAVRVLKSVGTLADGEREDSRRFWAAYEVAGFALGMPVSQVKRSGQYLDEYLATPGAEFDPWKIVYGNNPRAPENIGDFMEDQP